MRKTSGLAAIGTCVTLAACNGAAGPADTSLEQSVAAPQSRMMALSSGGTAATTQRAPAAAVVSLPAEAGSVSAVRGHDYVDGFRQDIMLKGSPVKTIANSVTVLARTSHVSTLDEATPLFKPAEAGIRSEMGRQFPHISMQVVERPSSNTYGPYGLALGRGPGTVHCVYMWQWIDENRLPAAAGVQGPISIRVRLCQADANFDAMAAMLDHLSIGSNGTALAANDTAGIVDAPVVAPVRKRVARAHHVKHVATVEPRAVAGDAVPAPAETSAPAAPASFATDLPPQALQGPSAIKKTN